MQQGQLFSAYFLDEGVRDSGGWLGITDQQLATARAAIMPLLDDFAERHEPNEAETETDLIEPVLRVLGWNDFLPQQTAARVGRSDVPDYLLFPEPEAKKAAAPLPSAEKYQHGRSILEAKAWEVSLDRATRAEGAPSTQLLRYLGRVEVESNGAIRFGLLTNGRVWRLYDQKARSRLEGYVEIDLFEAVGRIVPADAAQGAEPGRADHVLRLFVFLFGRDTFIPGPGGRTWLEQAIADSRGFEARVTKALAATVFERVFPDLAEALANADPGRPDPITPVYLSELREAALTWLYRLLFVLYAEDRDLLPTRRRRDGLRAMRNEVARAIDSGTPLSAARANHDGDLRALWRQVDEGDDGIGVPPYNGGLFRRDRSRLLERALIPDKPFAPLLDALSREGGAGALRLINYRDLDVQHLGSVYERLLEYELVHDGARISTRPQAFARKTSGSYYTPEELVMLVIRRTVEPLLDDKRAAFRQALADPERSGQPTEYRVPWLSGFDPASAFLTLRICDPAMGSGHFLVSLVDYLADQVMLATREAAELVAEQVEGAEYRSPLLDRLETIRARILAEASTHGWTVLPDQLADDKLVRRIILKRVIHGVDKNPMAVELAKLSLWLHTFTVGAPLSFLDHHLRCGDSLFGEWLHEAVTRLEAGGLFKRELLVQAERAISGMAAVEDRADADIFEANASSGEFQDARALIAPLERYLSLLQGYRWVEGGAQSARKQAKALQAQADRTQGEESFKLARQAWDMRRKGTALDLLLEGKVEIGGKPLEADQIIDLCYGRVGDPQPIRPGDDPALEPLIQAARVAAVSNFLHWELAFPTVWQNWMSPASRSGGFDAVIGNPPWDKLEFDETEWFKGRDDAIAKAKGERRKGMIARLRTSDPGLAQQAEAARAMVEMTLFAVRKAGAYPLISGRKINLAGLFCEQATRLVTKNGLVGLITPSGIAADQSASKFFRSLSTTGRLGSLLDYENRGRFFADVHRSFKFSVIAFGGLARRFSAAECGFFLTATEDDGLSDATFPLTPMDFSALNPNTGTAPVLRTRRDAELVMRIYSNAPVLVDRRRDTVIASWPIQYMQMLNMTSDSKLFKDAEELAAEGWYPVEGGNWRKGNSQAVPLYVGRMFHQFDHRAANVDVNEDNLENEAISDRIDDAVKSDPNFLVKPRYWVDEGDLVVNRAWALAFRDIARPTDIRTMIASILPGAAYGNKAPLLLTDDAMVACLLCGNLNSFVLDYVARSKIQSTSANWYIVEQLPILPPSAYDRRFGSLSAREIVAREVLRLTYTAHDMASFARDMGHVDEDGEVLPPFCWDMADRRQRRARLDALYFHLYGIGQDDADYILSTFPIVRRHDERDFGGRFVTRDLIIAHMAALAAGDTDVAIQLR